MTKVICWLESLYSLEKHYHPKALFAQLVGGKKIIFFLKGTQTDLTCSVVSHWCKWCNHVHCALIVVLEHMGNFSVRLPPGCSHHGISIHCMCVQISNLYTVKWPALPSCMQLTLVSWYVASMLCCHCWMFSLSDSLLMQSYPSVGYGSFAHPCRSLCSITYLFSRAYTVSWLVQIKVMLYLQQLLTCDSSSMLPTCFPYSPLCSLTYICDIYIHPPMCRWNISCSHILCFWFVYFIQWTFN